MSYLLGIAATAAAVVMIILTLSADKKVFAELLSVLIYQKKTKAEVLENKKLAYQLQVKNGEIHTSKKAFKKKIKSFDKDIASCRKEIEKFKTGKYSFLDLAVLPGYSLIYRMKLDANNTLIKSLIKLYNQIGEKKTALANSRFIIANAAAMAMYGVVGGFGFLAMYIAQGDDNKIWIVAFASVVLAFLFAYMPISNLRSETKERAESIERDFPNCVSKMALLVAAGMEVSRAWELASANETGVLYMEMRRVTSELNNNISPNEAYMNFINRCNSKYTTKLATAIIQNISKGNAEIVTVFRQLSDESWSEKKHNARRIGSNVSGKLLIPTMLTFAGILLLIMVPVASSMNSNMFG
ncbi:MAG: type II secretion system F family protein [Oscillospiraceae bacterium]